MTFLKRLYVLMQKVTICVRPLVTLVAVIWWTGLAVYADQVHRVAPGETLGSIAMDYGITSDTLMGHNQYITNPNMIYPGQPLIIPDKNRQYYLIRPGDTLSRISQVFGLPQSVISDINNIADVDLIDAGSILIVPKIYIIKPGDTISGISFGLNVSAKDLAVINNLNNPDLIYGGQSLIIPFKSKQREELMDIEKELNPIVDRSPDTIFYKGKPGQMKIALTFDDGPSRKGTQSILDTLKKYNVSATFFLSGSSILGNEDVLKRTISEGHMIASHTGTHPDLRKLTKENIWNELTEMENKVYDITGLRMTLMRPPYGFLDDNVALSLRDMGYKAIKWSVDTKDWQEKDIDGILINTMPNIRDGSIILMHDTLSESATNMVLPEIIRALRHYGYTFVKVDELLGINAYK